MRSFGSVTLASVAAFLAVVVTLSADTRATMAAPAADEVVIAMTDAMVFDPATITVPVGTTVTWVNQGIAPHAVKAADDSFDSGSDPSQWIIRGGRFSFTFDVPGTYDYVCEPHQAMGMVGTVIVQ